MSEISSPNPDFFVPAHSIDCVIIGFTEGDLKILVHKWKFAEAWGLPGGFIMKDENMGSAAVRTLKELTGIELAYLEQFKTFGKVDRNTNNAIPIDKIDLVLPEGIKAWFNQRFISTGYLSLVNIDKCELKPNMLSEKLEWISINDLPPMTYDHNEIVDTAIDFLKKKLNYIPIGINLLPEKFTMKTLQKLYESILGRALDRGNFQRKMLKTEIFIRHEKELKGGAHKAPYLYSFDKNKYEQLLIDGMGFTS